VRALLALAILSACHAQTFEVASIKPTAESEVRKRADIQSVPGSVTMRSVGLIHLMIWSYKISPYQVTNPGVSENVRFDIQAKAAGPAKTDEMRLMMQKLLAERFQVKLHRETREMPAYVIVEAKGGHKLTPTDAPDGQGVLPVTDPNKMMLVAKAATLDQLAMFLSDPLHTPVVDQTGLKGRFDFTFDITDFTIRAQRQPGEPEPDPVSILQQALPKQLGLKLESRKAPIEMFTIDRIETKPAEN
jgi:uncharacterized protein (TIGR03435 family)